MLADGEKEIENKWLYSEGTSDLQKTEVCKKDNEEYWNQNNCKILYERQFYYTKNYKYLNTLSFNYNLRRGEQKLFLETVVYHYWLLSNILFL